MNQDTHPMPMQITKAGYVAIAGRPNVGKSTLVNALVGEKVCIVTAKPHTTRHAIRGVCQHETTQLVLVDLPGIHQGVNRALNRAMNRTAKAALNEVDVILVLVEAGRFSKSDQWVLDLALESGLPLALAITKVDQVKDKTRLLPFLQEMGQRADWRFVVPISSTKSDNLDALAAELSALMPDGEEFYDAGVSSDRSDKFRVAETIREKLMGLLNQELPYALTVEVESMQPVDEKMEISAIVWVERESHKPIVIGQRGSGLKQVGIAARKDIESMLGQHVDLRLWVKVRKNWSDDERALAAFDLYSEK